MTNMYQKYIDLGWSCFPVKFRDKMPMFSWKEYQERLATPEEIAGWVNKYRRVNVAVATGAVSGVIVVDIDSDDGRANLDSHGVMPRTPQQTSGKGKHYFFKHPGYHVCNKASFVPGVDLRGDGGYIIVAPSVHPTGRKYEWTVTPDDTLLAEIPEWLMYLLKPKPAVTTGSAGDASGDGDHAFWLTRALERATPGNRDHTAFWLACQLRDAGLTTSAAETTLELFASQCQQGDAPYTVKEARRKVLSAWTQPARSAASSGRVLGGERPDTTLYPEENWNSATSQEPPRLERSGSKSQPQPTPEPKRKLFITSGEVNRDLVDEVLGDKMPDGIPFEFPCKAMWRLGGYAHYMWTKKLWGILGISGGLKTTLTEFFQDNLLKAGMDWVHYGPEWSPSEMGIRGMQRYNGATLDQMAAARIHAYDIANGITPPRGKPLNNSQKANSLGIIGDRDNWPGRGYYVPSADLSFDKVCQGVIDACEDSRSRGRMFTAAFFDYLEMMNRFSPKGDDAKWGERIAGQLKAVAIEYDFTAVILMQAKKGKEEAIKNCTFDGKILKEIMLGQSDAQGISSQQFNLFLTVNPLFDYDRKITKDVLINVAKNSGGDPGVVELEVNPRLMQFRDIAGATK